MRNFTKIKAAGFLYRSLEILTRGLRDGNVPALGSDRVAIGECFAPVEKTGTTELESDSERAEVHNNSSIVLLAAQKARETVRRPGGNHSG